MTPGTAQAPEQWFTLEEAATICRRTPKTLQNLISRHQLPRKASWFVQRRLRRRRILLSPSVVAYLQRVTLYGEDPRTLPRPPK